MLHTILQPERVLTRATGTPEDFPVWIPIVAAIGALLLLAIIVIILYFVSYNHDIYKQFCSFKLFNVNYKLQYHFSHLTPEVEF